MVGIENISHMREITCKDAFLGYLVFLALSRIKWFKLGLFGTKLGTQHYLVHKIVLKLSESEIIVICLKLRAKLRVCGF